ncbi:hypothetical protein AAG570_001408 [Ranatra chinensis]|uniref:Uncharacterized protein n=1 Tax=Ranatra chinensis TaxID=642074 RepID=A0ABD0YC12_9HEMI
MLDDFERKVLRRIFGLVNDDGRWRMRTNEELRLFYQDVSLSTFIRLQRLRWYVDLERISDDRLAMRLFQNQPHGSRPRGRPRNRWADAVRADMGSAGIPPDFDGQEGKRLVKEARDHWVSSAI